MPGNIGTAIARHNYPFGAGAPVFRDNVPCRGGSGSNDKTVAVAVAVAVTAARRSAGRTAPAAGPGPQPSAAAASRRWGRASSSRPWRSRVRPYSVRTYRSPGNSSTSGSRVARARFSWAEAK